MARTQHSKLIDKVGTSSSPVLEVNTEQLFNASYRDRPLFSKGTKAVSLSDLDKDVVTVTSKKTGTDETVWILKGIPRIIQHSFTININSSIPDIHLYVPPTWVVERGDQTEYLPLEIMGDESTPSNIKVASITVRGFKGWNLAIGGVALQEPEPFTNEGGGLHARGCDEILFRNSVFEGGVEGVMSYASHVLLKNVDFGSSVLSAHAIDAKHNGVVWEDLTTATPTSGNSQDYAYNVSNGQIFFAGKSSTLTGDPGLVDIHGGLVYDSENHTIYRGASSVYAYLDTAQAVPSATWTTVEFDAIKYDKENDFDTANLKFVAPDGGKYSIDFMARWDDMTADSGTEYIVKLWVNRSTPYNLDRGTIGSALQTMDGSLNLNLAENDEITVDVYQGSGGSRTLTATAQDSRLCIERVD